MKKPILAAAACSGMLALGLLTAVTAHASSAPAIRLTWARITAMAPAQIAALQNPLIATADPIYSAGTTTMAGLYSSVALDTPRGVIDVYVTDPARAGQLLQSAKKKDPSLNVSRIRVLKSAYSLAALTSATDRIAGASTAGHIPFRVYAIDQAYNGQGLELEVPDPAAARTLSARPAAALGGKSLRQFAGVTLTFAHGTQMVPASREDDSSPYIGGDQSYGWNSPEKKRVYCTAGIPVESNSSGEDGLIEAGHCFTPNNGVYTSSSFDHYIGTASGVSDGNDAEIIWTGKYGGAGSNADEGESDGCGGICYFPLVKTVNPILDEYVCQDGVRSYIDGRGVPCNIQVISSSSYEICPEGDGYCGYVSGLQTKSNNGKPIVVAGDSGAVVFTIGSPSTRNALGMVDASSSGCGLDCTLMSFVPQGAIMQAFGVHLNPHQ